MVGAGASEGAIDASNMLKPLLARGELHTIGATTLDEYRKYIEKDAALERRFQPVLVAEPTVEDTISVLRGPARAVRDPPRREVQGRRPGRGRGALEPLHQRPFPAGQGHRSHRRGGLEAAHRDRLAAGGARRGRTPHHATGDRTRGAAQGDGRRLARPASGAWRRSWPICRRSGTGCARGGSTKRRRFRARATCRASSRRCATRWSGRSARETTRALPSCSTDGSRSSSGSCDRAARPRHQARACSRKRWMNRDIAAVVSKWTHIPVSRLVEGEIEKLVRMEDSTPPARDRPGRRRHGGLQRDAARPRRTPGSRPPARQLHLPRDRPASARRSLHAPWPSSSSTTNGPMVRIDMSGVPGEALHLAAGRRPSRLRRPRRGGPAHRGRAAASVLRGVVRRGREGPSGRAQRHAAASGRRPPDRRQGADGGFPERRRHHDLEPGQRVDRRARHGRRRPGRGHAAADRRRRATALPARVPQSRRRDHRLSRPRTAPSHGHRGHPARPSRAAAGRAPGHDRDDRRRVGLLDRRGVRPCVRGRGRCAARSSAGCSTRWRWTCSGATSRTAIPWSSTAARTG